MNDIILTFRGENCSLFHSDDFIVENIENLTWGQNELALTENPYLAGDTVQNNRGMARDITISLKPTKDKGEYGDIIHKFARMQGSEVTLTWKDRTIPSYTYFSFLPHTEENLVDPLVTDLTISGKVKEFETPRFENGVLVNFTVHCSDPYWKAETQAIHLSRQTTPEFAYFCNYSEVKTGLVIDVPDFSLPSNNDYINIDFNVYDEANMFTIRLINLTNGSVGGDFFRAVFEKGKVTLLLGDDEYSATNASTEVGWKIFRQRRIGENAYQPYEVTEFPYFPFSESSEQVVLLVTQLLSGATIQPEATIKQTPCFL